MKELHYEYILDSFQYNVFSSTTDRLTWGVVFKPLNGFNKGLRHDFIEKDLKALKIDYDIRGTSFIGSESEGFLVYMKFGDAVRFIENYSKSCNGNFADQARDLILIKNMKNIIDACYSRLYIESDCELSAPSIQNCSYHKPKLYCEYVPEQIHFMSDKQMILFSARPICDEYIANSLSCMIAKDLQKLGYMASKDFRILQQTDDDSVTIEIFTSNLAQKLIKCSMNDEHEAEKIYQSIENLFSTKMATISKKEDA